MFKIVTLLALMVIAIGVVAILNMRSADTVTAEELKLIKFSVGLSGDQEVSEVITNTTGSFKIRFDRELSEGSFRLHVFNGVGITQAHLHCGVAGENGPVVAFVAGAFPSPLDVDGLLSQGTLTNDDIIGRSCDLGADNDFQVNNIASLAMAARQNGIYVNVHSSANPPGEIRGQLYE